MQQMPLAPSRGRFLHLVPDDKFIDAARGIFEEASPGAHDYLFLGSRPLRYLRTFEPVRLEIGRVLEPGFLATLSAYSAVFVHFLSDQARLIVASAPVATRFIWLGWGADFYHLIHSRDELLLPKTRVLLSSPHLRCRNAYDASIRLAKQLRLLVHPRRVVSLLEAHRELHRIGRNAPAELKLINRFSAIATPIIEDFDAIRMRHPDLYIPFLDWNYRTEGIDEDDGPSAPRDDLVLLGNSATPENNHLEMLDTLSECLPADRGIVCPLSYGSRPYGDAVERYGKTLFGDRFVALREYMPSSLYMRVIESCSVVVMNHIRQQALGNILIALCAGARVFLHSKSPINLAMKRIGVDISTTDSLPDFFANSEAKLLASDLQATRRRIRGHFGHASILCRTRTLLDDFR